MSHISFNQIGVRASFDASERSTKPTISFVDPSYAKANLVLLDLDDMTVHVVMHEGIFMIGKTNEDFIEKAMKSMEVQLCADLSNGDHISLHAPVSISGKANVQNVVPLTVGEMPCAAAGGYAMTSLA